MHRTLWKPRKGREGLLLDASPNHMWLPLVVDALEEAVKTAHIEDDALTIKILNEFCSARGRRFYEKPHRNDDNERILLERKGEKVSLRLSTADAEIEIVPFRSREVIRSVTWLQQSNVVEKKG